MKSKFLAAAVVLPASLCMFAGVNLLGAAPAAAATPLPAKCTPSLAGVPQIDVPMHPEWKTVYDFAWSNWKRLILVGTRMYNPCWIDEGFGAGGATWQWDTNFGTIGARWGYRQFPAIETQENFYFAQGANGYIGQKLSESSESFKATSVNPPFYPWVEWEYYQITGDASRFTKVINGRTVLKHLRDHFYFFWNSSKYHRADGTWVWSGIDSGRDCVSAGSYVDLPAQLATTAYYLAKMAGVAGDTALRDDMLDKHRKLSEFLNARHWNPAAKFYQNLASTSTFDLNQDGPQGLWTLIGRVPTAQQVADLLPALLDPNRLYRYHPVPSVSAASPYYYAGCKWYGPTWPPDVILTVKGLVAQGQFAAAYEIARRDVEKTTLTYLSNGGRLCENYHADRDGCYGGSNLTWSSAAFVVSLLDVVFGLEPDAPHDGLLWTINLLEEHSVSQLSFGDNTVTLKSAARATSDKGARLTVTTNSPFTLTVRVAGTTCTRSVQVGPTTFDCGQY